MPSQSKSSILPSILLIGNLEGWMGIHVRQFSAGFESMGCRMTLMDYHRLEKSLNIFSRSEVAKHARAQSRLKKQIAALKPDFIFFIISHMDFNFPDLREFFKGRIIVFDYDGRKWPCYSSFDWMKSVDIVFSVSAPVTRTLASDGYPVHYLAHGVDCDYFSPGKVDPAKEALFKAKISFVAKTTPRRITMCEKIATEGLAVWGKRWSRKKYCRSKALSPCIRANIDFIGADLVDIYRSAGIVLNILQEPLHLDNSIMSLQVFGVPATGTCLLTEWVEELPNAFEIGKEVLTFQNENEFVELVCRYTRDERAAKAIGEAGRRRCLAEHTHTHRAKHILEILS